MNTSRREPTWIVSAAVAATLLVGSVVLGMGKRPAPVDVHIKRVMSNDNKVCHDFQEKHPHAKSGDILKWKSTAAYPVQVIFDSRTPIGVDSFTVMPQNERSFPVTVAPAVSDTFPYHSEPPHCDGRPPGPDVIVDGGTVTPPTRH